MICHRHLADRLSFIGLTAVSLSLFLVDCGIKSTGTLAYPKASFGPALELSRSPRPRVLHQLLLGTQPWPTCPGIPAVGRIGSVLLFMAKDGLGTMSCHPSVYRGGMWHVVTHEEDVSYG